jgi:hypothetical protein
MNPSKLVDVEPEYNPPLVVRVITPVADGVVTDEIIKFVLLVAPVKLSGAITPVDPSTTPVFDVNIFTVVPTVVATVGNVARNCPAAPFHDNVHKYRDPTLSPENVAVVEL